MDELRRLCEEADNRVLAWAEREETARTQKARIEAAEKVTRFGAVAAELHSKYLALAGKTVSLTPAERRWAA